MLALLRWITVFALANAAWAENGAIIGVVKYSNGAVARDVIVVAEREDGNGGQKAAKTDSHGRYHCNGLPAGLYRLVLSVGGHAVQTFDHVQAHPGSATPINFVIKIP